MTYSPRVETSWTPRPIAECMYDRSDGPTSALTIRRAAYREFAIQQEGGKRSVYLSRGDVVRLAFRLLREAAKR